MSVNLPTVTTPGGQPILTLPTIQVDESGAYVGNTPQNIQPPIPATIFTGQLALAANTRAQLPSHALVNGITIRAAATNAADVLIGGIAVTVVQTGSGNGDIISPGEKISFAVSNSNAIYAISTVAAVLTFSGN